MRLLALTLGAGGQLGEAMASALPASHEAVALTRRELDVTDAGAVRKTIGTLCPDIIINCAAYTHVDAAEGEPVQAFAANASAVGELARMAREINALFVHFSTNFVFDGETDRPYVEDDPPNPRGTYATSKLLGEWLAAEAPRHYVLRVQSLFGGARARSSVDRILESVRAGSEVRAFADTTVSPSYVYDVVGATLDLIRRELPYGTYHCVNSGYTTWSGLAQEIVRLTGSQARINDIRLADAGLVAKRPRFAAMSNDKLARAGILMPTWQEALKRHLQIED